MSLRSLQLLFAVLTGGVACAAGYAIVERRWFSACALFAATVVLVFVTVDMVTP